MKRFIEKMKNRKEEKEQALIKAREEDIAAKSASDPEFREMIKHMENLKKGQEQAVTYQMQIQKEYKCPMCNGNNWEFAETKKSQYVHQATYQICRRCGYMYRYYNFASNDYENFDQDEAGNWLLIRRRHF